MSSSWYRIFNTQKALNEMNLLWLLIMYYFEKLLEANKYHTYIPTHLCEMFKIYCILCISLAFLMLDGNSYV